MPFTRGAREVPNQTPASESDAPDLPPVLPDTSGWVKRVPGDVIERGEPYVARSIGFQSGGPVVQWKPEGRVHDWRVESYHMDIWTPPPAPREPWSVLSTDRDKPTLAKVTLDLDDGFDTAIGSFWIDDDGYLTIGRVVAFAHRTCIARVELLHTYDPETHVPVERALIDEAVRWVEWTEAGMDKNPRPPETRSAISIVRALAALADGAES